MNEGQKKYMFANIFIFVMNVMILIAGIIAIIPLYVLPFTIIIQILAIYEYRKASING